MTRFWSLIVAKPISKQPEERLDACQYRSFPVRTHGSWGDVPYARGGTHRLHHTRAPVCWVARAVPKTPFCFIRNAMTGFIACVFLYRNHVPLQVKFEGLEPDERNFHARF
jgi:hypothetical protein